MLDLRRDFTIRLRNSHAAADAGHRASPTLIAIVFADDLADAEEEAERLVQSLNGQVAVVSIERGSFCGR